MPLNLQPLELKAEKSKGIYSRKQSICFGAYIFSPKQKLNIGILFIREDLEKLT